MSFFLGIQSSKNVKTSGDQMRKMFLDLLAMCEEFETRVSLLEAKANECQYKTKTFVNEHSNIWECISKNLEKKKEMVTLVAKKRGLLKGKKLGSAMSVTVSNR